MMTVNDFHFWVNYCFKGNLKWSPKWGKISYKHKYKRKHTIPCNRIISLLDDILVQKPMKVIDIHV